MHIRKKKSWNLYSSHDHFNDRCFVSSTITSLHVACIFSLIHHRTFLVIGLGTKTILQEFDDLHINAEFHELCHHLCQLEVSLCVTHLSPFRCPFGRELFIHVFLIPKKTPCLVIVAFFRLPSIFIEALTHDSFMAPKHAPNGTRHKKMLLLSVSLKILWSWPDRVALLCGASCQSRDQPTSVWLKWPRK